MRFKKKPMNHDATRAECQIAYNLMPPRRIKPIHPQILKVREGIAYSVCACVYELGDVIKETWLLFS